MNAPHNEPQFIVCESHTPGGIRYLITLLPLDVVSARGLIPQAIVGQLVRPLGVGEAITPEVFARNGAFVDFMHDVIARYGAEQPGARAEAARLGEGLVCVIDRRTPTPSTRVPPHDIIGWFRAAGGIVVADSYQRCPAHRILSADGFFRLPSARHAALLRELETLSESAG